MGVEATGAGVVWTGASASETVSITIAGGSNRKVIACTGYYDSDATSCTAVFDAVGVNEPMIAVTNSPYEPGSSLHVNVFYLDDASLPSAGTYDVTFTWTSNVYRGAGAVYYLEDMASGQVDSSNGDYDTGTATPSNTVTANTGDTVIDMVAAVVSGGTTVTAGSGQTEALDVSDSSILMCSSYATNEDTMSWSEDGGNTGAWASLSVVLNASAASSIIPQVSHHSNIILG